MCKRWLGTVGAAVGVTDVPLTEEHSQHPLLHCTLSRHLLHSFALFSCNTSPPHPSSSALPHLHLRHGVVISGEAGALLVDLEGALLQDLAPHWPLRDVARPVWPTLHLASKGRVIIINIHYLFHSEGVSWQK